VRAVLDVNVLVSALLARDGNPAEVVREWLRGRFELVASPMLLDELRRVLAYPKILKRVSVADADAFVQLITDLGLIRDDPPEGSPIAVPDPSDEYLVALASGHGAILVTGDAGVLSLARAGVAIMAPAGFAELIRDLE
jgi:putative PIN family toxin of toxin-antitoxin system